MSTLIFANEALYVYSLNHRTDNFDYGESYKKDKR